MNKRRDVVVLCLLLATIGLLIILNTYHLLHGQLLSALPLVVQALVLVFVLRGLPGAVWVTRLWAVVVMLAGGFYWLSIVLKVFSWAVYPEGGPLSAKLDNLTLGRALAATMALVLGIIFVARARAIIDMRREVAHGGTTSN